MRVATLSAPVDHNQGTTGDRYAHILFGSGATLKQKAYEVETNAEKRMGARSSAGVRPQRS